MGDSDSSGLSSVQSAVSEGIANLATTTTTTSDAKKRKRLTVRISHILLRLYHVCELGRVFNLRKYELRFLYFFRSELRPQDKG
jgi:hypothetical protein